MSNTINKPGITGWLHLVFGVGLLITFFLPWVSWSGMPVTGAAIATGDFFKTSVAVSGPENPFPKLAFSFYIFWLIPLLAVISVILVLLKKKVVPFSFIGGSLSLALITVYFFFTTTLAVDFSIGNNVWGMLKISAYLHALCAAGLILTAFPVKTWLPKFVWLLLGPALAYGAYQFGEKQVMAETFTTTDKVKADYTIAANDLIREFMANDTATNKKYLDKTLVVNGEVSAVDMLPDSTGTIKFADSTGSYVIFSLEKDQLNQVKNIMPGDPVSLKGVCSGSIYSEILGTTSISFKRAILNLK